MRKLLLATTAMLGGGLILAGAASAQVKLPDGQTLVTPFNGSGFRVPQKPEPGNISVHMNGEVMMYAGAYFDQGANYNAPARTPSLTGSLNNIPAGPQKLNTVSFGTTVRFKPGFSGIAANGMQYGAVSEFRMDQKGTPANNSYNLKNGSFGNPYGGALADPSVETRTRNSLYLFQAFGYAGMPKLGMIVFGMTAPASVMMMTGVMGNFNDGGWHDAANLSGVNSIMWPFLNSGVVGNANGITYLSPTFYGFDAGITFQPNTGGGNVWNGCVLGAAGQGCDRLSSTSDPASWGRRTNYFDVALRYRGHMGPVGLATSGSWVTSGRVTPSVTTGLTPFNTYKNLNMGTFGLQLSYAGFLVGGHVEFGQGNYQGGLQEQGGKPDRSWIAGITYTTGPVTVGAQYLKLQQGLLQVNSSVHGRTMQGPYVGAQYIVAPGFMTYVGYSYSADHQLGWDWVAGGPGPNNNNFHEQQVMAGAIMSW